MASSDCWGLFRCYSTSRAIVSLFGPPGGVAFSYLVIIKSMTHRGPRGDIWPLVHTSKKVQVRTQVENWNRAVYWKQPEMPTFYCTKVTSWTWLVVITTLSVFWTTSIGNKKRKRKASQATNTETMVVRRALFPHITWHQAESWPPSYDEFAESSFKWYQWYHFERKWYQGQTPQWCTPRTSRTQISRPGVEHCSRGTRKN